MSCTAQKNNLYDSVINEVEKITNYVNTLDRFSTEDFTMAEMENFNVDLMGFIQFRSQEILTDKLLRSFINIQHAFERCYHSVIQEISREETTIGMYTPEYFFEIYKTIDNIMKLRTRKKLYNPDINQYMIDQSFSEYVKNCEDDFGKYLENCDFEEKIVSIQELKDATDRCYEHIARFLSVMRCELEAKPYLNNSSIVMKHVFHIILISAMTASTVTIS